MTDLPLQPELRQRSDYQWEVILPDGNRLIPNDGESIWYHQTSAQWAARLWWLNECEKEFKPRVTKYNEEP